jgi:hypothetical protein
MAESLRWCEGAVRLTEALLQASGGTATLRMPAPAASGDEAEALGLATPEFNDVPLAPCVFRKSGNVKELLVSALAVEATAGSQQFDVVSALFANAAGVVVDGELFAIVSSVAIEQGCEALCYKLTLQAAAN